VRKKNKNYYIPLPSLKAANCFTCQKEAEQQKKNKKELSSLITE
jgi:hypothetical protein